jgi:transcriptional regulator with XRE-family HTH domain
VILNIPFSAMIGPVLATVRSLTGESQVAFAERAGVAGGQLSKYERSKQIPDTETAMRLLASAGWRFAAISDDEAGTLVERDGVVRAAQQWRDVVRGDDMSLGFADAEINLHAAVAALGEAQQAARDSGAPSPAEELVAARAMLDEQRAQIGELLPTVERLTVEVDRLRKAMRIASELMLTETGGPK